ncbi:MAG: hypothetical protein FD138_2496, partial [Planctomycetota bacterium]
MAESQEQRSEAARSDAVRREGVHRDLGHDRHAVDLRDVDRGRPEIVRRRVVVTNARRSR